jgi:hypothetical protein
MGACIVSGLNNWDRVARHRAAWTAKSGGEATEEDWQEEFRRLAADKPRYQDRLLLLSTGPYSAVAATDAGCDESGCCSARCPAPRARCTHLFTQRAFGVMRNHALDELLADFAGLVAAFGEYRPELARRFLGVEPGGGYRLGGRLQNYRGMPPLSEAAFAVLVGLVDAAIDRFAETARALGRRCAAPPRCARLVASAYRQPLTALARPASCSATVPPSTPWTWRPEVSPRARSAGSWSIWRLSPPASECPRRCSSTCAWCSTSCSRTSRSTPATAPPPAVIVAARRGGDVTLEIADDGPGVRPLAAPPPRLDLDSRSG